MHVCMYTWYIMHWLTSHVYFHVAADWKYHQILIRFIFETTVICYSIGKICQLTDVLYNPESAWVCLKAGQVPRSPLVNHFVPNQNSEKPISNSPEYQNVGMLVCWLCIFRYSPYLIFCILIKFLYVKGRIFFSGETTLAFSWDLNKRFQKVGPPR